MVAAGRPVAEPNAPLNQPVTFASAYHAGGELEYARFGNPTWAAFEAALGELEGGQALAFASGMAAAVAVLDQLPHGGRVVVPQHGYQGVLALLDTWSASERIRVTRVDVCDPDALDRAIPGADLVWVESPTNPALEVIDLARLAGVCRQAGVPLAVDNTFSTPLLQRPLELGADVVVHSATKLLSGHSDIVLGALVTADPVWRERLTDYRTLHGAIPGPMEVFLALRGLRTLGVRLQQAQTSARMLVQELSAHPAVTEVRYPGFGTIVALVLPDAASADRVVAAARLIRFATSLGGVESTMERRRRFDTESATIPDGLIRLSVGIEHPADLLADLRQALDAAR